MQDFTRKWLGRTFWSATRRTQTALGSQSWKPFPSLLSLPFGRDKNPFGLQRIFQEVLLNEWCDYNPYSQRYLFASDAWANGKSTEEIADVLGNTPEVTDKVYAIRTPGRKNQKVIRTVTDLFEKKPAAKRKA